ncbi:MAG: ABC transporter permease [Anaerolineales bacterium]|jgi:peptide/nickel transport system permease protein|nr:ABC transporter permease [Anaerolineales bacterium]MDP7346378.1 ABC transporter permease [Anaerolineales bacterium]MDP7645267.1 ABC transporter permease [Anaerolineales bacterium]|tara:strand:- start:1586 stop:2566 length:981 start_codon:yes stop_codon:yes gene_type:complete
MTTDLQPKMTGSAGKPVAEFKHVPLWRVRLGLMMRGLRSSWALFSENPIGLIGLGVIAFFALMTVVHPILMKTVWEPRTYDPVVGFDMETAYHPAPPSARHLLGTDPIGRDVLSQLMYSTRNEFLLGIMAAVFTVVIGTSIGAMAAYFGGVVDMLFMRLANLVIMIPALSILIVLSALASIGMLELAVVIGILSGFGGITVIIKSQGLAIKVKPYIEAARVAGGGHWHIIFRHMIPNLLPLSLLYMMFTVTGAIFSEAVLSFFGLTEISMSWGIMINTAQVFGYLLRFDSWFLVVPASLAISLLCSAFYLVGRALDEVVNPRLRRR